MSGNSTVNPKLRLLNALKQDQAAFATFMLLKGVRAAQIIAHTDLDVSASGISLRKQLTACSRPS